MHALYLDKEYINSSYHEELVKLGRFQDVNVSWRVIVFHSDFNRLSVEHYSLKRWNKGFSIVLQAITLVPRPFVSWQCLCLILFYIYDGSGRISVCHIKEK